MNETIETALAGYRNYDEYVSSFMDNVPFRGKPLTEWEKEVQLPSVSEHSDVAELRAANASFVNILRIVNSNLAYAKASLKSCEAHYESAMMSAKKSIIEEFEQSGGKRLPSIETLNSMAMERCKVKYIALTIAESFVDYWHVQNEKIRIFDSRLSGLGYLVSLEERYSTRGQ
jgi:hypothetical protein|nr:MAG TPA: hypothetical protein [Caudoviricetes sp.]